MKYLIFLFCAFILTGCSSLPNSDKLDAHQAYPGSPLPDEQIAIISVDCEKACKTAIESKLRMKISPISGRHLFETYVQEVDGKRGPYYIGPCADCDSPPNYDVYNQPAKGGYKLAVLPGIRELVVYVHFVGAKTPKQVPIKFEAKAGEKYFLGQFLRTIGTGTESGYSWQPIVVELSSNTVVYPTASQWLAH